MNRPPPWPLTVQLGLREDAVAVPPRKIIPHLVKRIKTRR